MNLESVFDNSTNGFVITDICKTHVSSIPLESLIQSLQTNSQYTIATISFIGPASEKSDLVMIRLDLSSLHARTQSIS